MKNFCLYGLILCHLLVVSAVRSQTDVLTQHYDQARTGWNNQETILNTTNVNSSSFGLLFKRAVDDQVYAQPLVVSGVAIPSHGTKNVVYVCTVNNTIYAYDADDGTASVYWQVNYTPSGYRPVNASDIFPGLCGGSYTDFSGNIGIVSTPVIDKTANTMYFVTKIASTSPGVVDDHPWDGNEYGYSTAGFHQFLHAVDLSTGVEKVTPIEITASTPGVGDGNISGIITFDPRRQLNRCGLVLSHGIVYLAFASHCDWNPSHGWLLGYNSTNLQQQITWVTTPNDGRGGIWMSGAAPAVDASGSLYFTSGNGYAGENGFTDDPSVAANRGESVIKLTPNTLDNTATALSITSYYTPHNYQMLDDGDLDFPTQAMLIPNTNMLLTGSKDNNLYVFNSSNLGGYSSITDNYSQQIYTGSTLAQMHSSFAYFGGASNQYVYQLSEFTQLQSYRVNSVNSLATPGVASSISGPAGSIGAFMSVSSNGTDATTGILWVSHPVNSCGGNICPGILRAIRADDVTKELWNSTLNSSDNYGNFAKMNCPSIANGKVYLATFSNQLAVFGLTTAPCSAPTSLSTSNISENGATISWQAVSGATSYNVQYKTAIVSSWVTRTTTSTSINLTALSCGTGYTWQVQAVCPSGNSAQATGTFITSNCTAICGSLPTGYNSADIGDIGAAGSSCLSNGVFTIKGSGNDIGGNSDEFQYAFATLNGDEHVYAEVLSQDAASPSDKAGIMFRDSVSNTARFAFIGTTSGNGIVFEYRSTPNGPTTVITIPVIAAPYWVSLNKTGTQYSAYISPTGAVGSWVQVGSTTDLGFGSSPVYVGLAVTSANNTALSTATFTNYIESALPLPVKLISFDGSNINNQYILLKWSTSSEINSSYFDVQRSVDGINYSNIARVSAADNSSIIHYYSATDNHPENGYNFYRLSMVDIDGTVSYSPIVRIKFGTQKAPQIFPNPASSYFTVTAGEEPVTEITLMDVSGKTIQRITNNSGATSMTIQSANLSSGIYIVQITTASSVYQKKLFKE